MNKIFSLNSLVNTLEGAVKLIYQDLQKQRKVADHLENIFETQTVKTIICPKENTHT